MFSYDRMCSLSKLLIPSYVIGQNERGQLGIASSSQMRWQCIYINPLSKSVSLPLGAKACYLKSPLDSGLIYQIYESADS